MAKLLEVFKREKDQRRQDETIIERIVRMMPLLPVIVVIVDVEVTIVIMRVKQVVEIVRDHEIGGVEIALSQIIVTIGVLILEKGVAPDLETGIIVSVIITDQARVLEPIQLGDDLPREKTEIIEIRIE
jgi:hypothetical protein